ncbi:CHAT domain-containing protein, partial [bacterium AH-315-J21]|nr:CHAT domain-containing protein [bacterium AH-315-J21]
EEFWSIKPDTFSTIFVASHSLVHTSQPERSALLLLPSETGAHDGLVQPIEIESHNWQSDLIFLSTCESGGGERVAGEGTLSLARSFIHGGAMNVIATMWPLDDRFSVNFSSRFFSEYRKDVSASQALRIAQQKTIRSSRALYKHPFYWASYHCIN